MNERVKEVRQYFKLSQSAFGDKLGIKQQAVAAIESQKAKLTSRNFNSICSVFNINPSWLENGEGTMFRTSDKSFLDQLAEEKSLDTRTKRFIGSIIDLPPIERSQLIDAMITFITALKAVPTPVY